MQLKNIIINLNSEETLTINIGKPEEEIPKVHEQIYLSPYIKNSKEIKLNTKSERYNNIGLPINNTKTTLSLAYNLKYGMSTYKPSLSIFFTKFEDYTDYNNKITFTLEDNTVYTLEEFLNNIDNLNTKGKETIIAETPDYILSISVAKDMMHFSYRIAKPIPLGV